MGNHARKTGMLCLMALVLLFTASCKKTPSAYILNDFESIQELFSIRPSIQRMRGTIDIVDSENGYVKSGKASMKFAFDEGQWPDLILHIRQAAYPELKVAEMDQMQLSVYSDNTAPVSGYVALVAEDTTPLLTQEFTLKPGMWNELVLSLGDHAGEFDPEQAAGFSFHADTGENTVFYFDTWSVTMAN